MRFTPILRATRRVVDAPPKIPVLPPLPLFRRILRAHQKLPADLRLMGTLYAKNEFKSMKEVDNPVLIMGFLSKWQAYLQSIDEDTWRDETLDLNTISQMESDKVIQLYELMMAAQGKKSEYKIFDDKNPK